MLCKANGMSLFYERTGEGRPVLLLHGNGEDHTIFSALTPLLSVQYAVYALDSRGHGQSGAVRELHYMDMARDVAAFIEQMDIASPIVVGFSDGGIIGLLTAIHFPGLIGALIACGANTQPKGVKGRYRTLMQAGYFFAKNDKLKLMLHEPDITKDMLKGITVPTLVLAGEKDIILEAHTRAIAEAIPHSVLCILPGHTHISYVQNGYALFEAAKPFLDALS